MCDPMTIALTTAAVSATSSVLGFDGQQQASEANAHLANQQAANQYNSLEAQRGQIDASQSENTVSAIVDRASREGAISAHAGTFGLGGSTAGRLENAAAFDVGRSLSIQNLNAQSQRGQNAADLTGSRLEQQTRINSMPKPSALGLVLGVAKAGLQGTGAYMNAGGTFGQEKA
jgi:hypothetical protein